jgi:hypothetical protein
VARSPSETLTAAAQAAAEARDRERDQVAWNLPRSPEEAIGSGAEEHERDTGERHPGERRAEPSETIE